MEEEFEGLELGEIAAGEHGQEAGGAAGGEQEAGGAFGGRGAVAGDEKDVAGAAGVGDPGDAGVVAGAVEAAVAVAGLFAGGGGKVDETSRANIVVLEAEVELVFEQIDPGVDARAAEEDGVVIEEVAAGGVAGVTDLDAVAEGSVVAEDTGDEGDVGEAGEGGFADDVGDGAGGGVVGRGEEEGVALVVLDVGEAAADGLEHDEGCVGDDDVDGAGAGEQLVDGGGGRG